MDTKSQALVLWVFNQLHLFYGGKKQKREKDQIGILVRTILSQNTNDKNRDRAYCALLKRFPSWESLAQAGTKEIESAIKSGGLAKQKAKRIKELLKRIKKEQGKISLSFLSKMSPEQAKGYLLGFKGIGEKTASVLLLFGFGMELFPVDTHILRISKRLGILPEKVSAKIAHKILAEIVPGTIAYELHLNLIEHGRKICSARKPNCPLCPLKLRCQFYNSYESEGCKEGK